MVFDIHAQEFRRFTTGMTADEMRFLQRQYERLRSLLAREP
jgi:hypothetical protein